MVTHYEYDGAGQVTRQYVEVDGTVLSDTRMDYDALGRAYRTRELATPGACQDSRAPGWQDTTDDSLDRICERGWDYFGNLLDERRRLGVSSDYGAETSYGYDGQGRRLTEHVLVWADANWTLGSGTGTAILSSTTYYGYDGRGNLTCQKEDAIRHEIDNDGICSETVVEEYVSTFSCDAAGRQYQELRYELDHSLNLQVDSLYDSRGHKICQVERDGGTGEALTQQRWTYDAFDRLGWQAQMGDPGPLPDPADQAPPSAALNRVTNYTYDSASERPKTVTTHGGYTGTDRTTTYDYDGLGRAKKITDPNGNTQDLVYKPIGSPGDGQVGTKTITNPGLTDPSGADISQQVFEYGYDGLGRKTSETAKGRTTADDLTTTYGYDGLGHCTTVVNPKQFITLYQFNHFGDQTQMVEDAGGLARTTDLHYDQLGRLDTQTTDDGDSHTETTTYAYDLADHRTGITFPDGHGYTYAYDGAGHMTSRTDPRSQVTTYTNNWRGQPLTKTVQASASDPAVLKESFTYYPAGWMKTAWMDTDTVAAATNKSEFACNAFGQVTSVTQTVDGVAREIDSTFYASGERLQLTYPAGVGVSLGYVYDDLGQTTCIAREVDGGDYTPLATYTYAGRNVTSREITTTAAGAATHVRYEVGLDVHRRQVQLANKSVVGSTTTLLDQYVYTYDANGNRQTATIGGDARLGSNTTYGYDNLDRVTGADYGTGNGSEAFAYDLLGNRRGDAAGYTDRQGRQSTYQHNEVNEYTGITTAGQPLQTPVHDEAGNLTSNGSGYGFAYDYENHLTRVFVDGNHNGQQDTGETVLADYTYDALGHRVKQVKAGQTTLFYYDGETVLAEYNGTGSLQRYHVHGPTYVDEHVVLHEAGATPAQDHEYYYLLTSLYSVSGLADASGAVVERYRYDAYGMAAWLSAVSYGDFNGDGKVDLQDFLIFQAAFSGESPCSEAGRICDSNGDGKVDLEDYRAFDAVWTGSGGSGATSSISPFRFTGQPLDFQLSDPTTGRTTLVLYHCRARGYEAYLGRWMQGDPALYQDSMNLFEYVKSHPTYSNDPTGACASLWLMPDPEEEKAEAEDAAVSESVRLSVKEFVDVINTSEKLEAEALELSEKMGQDGVDFYLRVASKLKEPFNEVDAITERHMSCSGTARGGH